MCWITQNWDWRQRTVNWVIICKRLLFAAPKSTINLTSFLHTQICSNCSQLNDAKKLTSLLQTTNKMTANLFSRLHTTCWFFSSQNQSQKDLLRVESVIFQIFSCKQPSFEIIHPVAIAIYILKLSTSQWVTPITQYISKMDSQKIHI